MFFENLFPKNPLPSPFFENLTVILRSMSIKKNTIRWNGKAARIIQKVLSLPILEFQHQLEPMNIRVPWELRDGPHQSNGSVNLWCGECSEFCSGCLKNQCFLSILRVRLLYDETWQLLRDGNDGDYNSPEDAFSFGRLMIYMFSDWNFAWKLTFYPMEQAQR